MHITFPFLDGQSANSSEKDFFFFPEKAGQISRSSLSLLWSWSPRGGPVLFRQVVYALCLRPCIELLDSLSGLLSALCIFLVEHTNFSKVDRKHSAWLEVSEWLTKLLSQDNAQEGPAQRPPLSNSLIEALSKGLSRGQSVDSHSLYGPKGTHIQKTENIENRVYACQSRWKGNETTWREPPSSPPPPKAPGVRGSSRDTAGLSLLGCWKAPETLTESRSSGRAGMNNDHEPHKLFSRRRYECKNPH